MNDEKLVQRIKSGDTEALDILIIKYYNSIYTYCYRKLGRKQDAQDITQEVFLRFCRNFDNYKQKGKCKSYLYVIAHNLCINIMQKKIPIPLKYVEKENLSENDAALDQFEADNSIRTALNKLPEEQKEVILLRFYHDFKLKEIARIMNCGLSITKYRLNQGLKKLSELMAKEDWL